MTVINHKSISGITSITAPAGSDNLLTVHTNDTTERFRIVDSGAIVTGVTTASNFKTGTTNVHNVGVELAGINVLGADTPIGTGATIYNSGAAVFTGIVTAARVTVSSQLNIADAIVHSGNDNAKIRFPDTDIFTVETGGAEALRIDSSGNVGINSTSPTYALEVDGGTQNTVIAVRSSDAKAAISFLDSTSGGYGRATIGGEGDQVYITSGAGAERIRFGTGGSNNSIGISTTLNLVTNSEVLAVRGTSSFKSHTQVRPALYLGNEGSVTDTANALILFNQDGANRGGIGYVPNTGELRFNNQYFITFTTGASTLAGTERLRITSTGDVGINCTPHSNAGINLQIHGDNTTSEIRLTNTTTGSGNNGGTIQMGGNTFYISNSENGSTVFENNGSERLRIDKDGNVYFSGSQSGNNRGIIYNHGAGFGIYASADSSTDRNIKFYSNSSSGSQKFAILANGVLQHTPTGGPSTFNSTSEYVFGSATSSPPSGGAEANFQIHAAKTRAHLSINAYMNNAGGPFMQFISSRSGTVGTLGTKCQNNDYLGEIRFLGDNGTNYNSLCQGASIYAQAASTPADGDTTIAGEIYFATGTASGGSQPVRLCIDSAGRLTMNECGRVGNAKALRMKCDNDTTSNASSDRTGSNSYKNSAIIIEKGISNGGLVAGLIDAWDGAIHGTSIGIIYTSGRYHTSFGVNNDTNDRPVEIMTISGNKTVKIGGGIANISASVGLEIGGDGATTEIRLKNSGGGTGTSDGFAIQKWSNGNNYIYDYDSNNILFGTGNLSRTSMDTSGRWCFSPGPSIQTASSVFTMSLIHEGNFSGTGIYPGIAMKSTDTNGGDGMVIHAYDGNWDLYTKSGVDGISIADNALVASSGNSRVCIGGDGVVTMGKSVHSHLQTSRYCGTALHIAGGALSIGGNGSGTAANRAGVYTLGWFITQHANANFYHLKTDLWAGGSPHGNNEYIMGGFRIEGYSYSSPTGSSTAWIQFHNWSGSYPGLSVKQHYHNWDMNPTVYTSSDGYVVLRVNGGTYKGHVIDLIQHTNYGSRDINVSATAYNNNSTHF